MNPYQAYSLMSQLTLPSEGMFPQPTPVSLRTNLFFFVNNLTFSGVNRKQYLLTTVFLSKICLVAY